MDETSHCRSPTAQELGDLTIVELLVETEYERRALSSRQPPKNTYELNEVRWRPNFLRACYYCTLTNAPPCRCAHAVDDTDTQICAWLPDAAEPRGQSDECLLNNFLGKAAVTGEAVRKPQRTVVPGSEEAFERTNVGGA